MPLSGLVLNRTHPTLSALPSDHALAAADQLAEEEGVDAKAAEAVLRIHAHRAVIAKRELRLLRNFTAANPAVPVVGYPRCLRGLGSRGAAGGGRAIDPRGVMSRGS